VLWSKARIHSNNWPSHVRTFCHSFFDVWHTYRKVVAANYMHHMEIRAQLEGVLLAQFGSRPFSFLDLGCGDAAALAPLLASMAVQRYKGVDLSELRKT
jgi:hypothetical protein